MGGCTGSLNRGVESVPHSFESIATCRGIRGPASDGFHTTHSNNFRRRRGSRRGGLPLVLGLGPNHGRGVRGSAPSSGRRSAPSSGRRSAPSSGSPTWAEQIGWAADTMGEHVAEGGQHQECIPVVGAFDQRRDPCVASVIPFPNPIRRQRERFAELIVV